VRSVEGSLERQRGVGQQMHQGLIIDLSILSESIAVSSIVSVAVSVSVPSSLPLASPTSRPKVEPWLNLDLLGLRFSGD
jgi:hypothetical protein